jgi:hypothetical protein
MLPHTPTQTMSTSKAKARLQKSKEAHDPVFNLIPIGLRK